jgi:MFS family permease
VSATAAFAVGAVCCAAAPDMPALVLGRALQGLGGGMMIASVHGLLRQEFPEPLWPRLLASISAAWGIAALTGPAVGGVAGRGMWRAAFAVMLPLAAFGALLTWRLLGPGAPAPRDGERGVPLGRLAPRFSSPVSDGRASTACRSSGRSPSRPGSPASS